MQSDAFGVLRRGGKEQPFFLEWERRAVRPVTMAARTAAYLRYYATNRPLDYHGITPAVLVLQRLPTMLSDPSYSAKSEL